VHRDVPQFSFFGIAALAILIPAGVITWKFMNFEHLRWAESDYGVVGLTTTIPPGRQPQLRGESEQ